MLLLLFWEKNIFFSLDHSIIPVSSFHSFFTAYLVLTLELVTTLYLDSLGSSSSNAPRILYICFNIKLTAMFEWLIWLTWQKYLLLFDNQMDVFCFFCLAFLLFYQAPYSSFWICFWKEQLSFFWLKSTYWFNENNFPI